MYVSLPLCMCVSVCMSVGMYLYVCVYMCMCGWPEAIGHRQEHERNNAEPDRIHPSKWYVCMNMSVCVYVCLSIYLSVCVLCACVLCACVYMSVLCVRVYVYMCAVLVLSCHVPII